MKKLICELHDEMIPKRPKPPKNAKCGTCAHYHETRPKWHSGNCDLHIMDGLPCALTSACDYYEQKEVLKNEDHESD